MPLGLIGGIQAHDVAGRVGAKSFVSCCPARRKRGAADYERMHNRINDKRFW